MELKASAKEMRGRMLAPWFLDLRGNAFSVASYHHIHHPIHPSDWRWADIVYKLLENHWVGLHLRDAPCVVVAAFHYARRSTFSSYSSAD